ncbi:leucine-rich repeat domain-containing protein [Phthorimaea operculella]|nr:leucine-rich repeat domain-containing protein [Phthorimaea operculella]
MVRRKTEHHECLLGPVEEIALHQEHIEKIEHLQDWCPKLKILLLQSNLIAKIENLNKLKHLTYLNLALNNIEIIENLERCESLQKLDLTLNFIGNIVSLESLVDNYNLENLYLTGNPCTDYDNYRQFVIGTLPQLSSLDGKEIERSDRIKALQHLPFIRADIIFEQSNYLVSREKQKIRLENQIGDKWENEYKDLDLDEKSKRFYAEKCEHAPEVRYEMEKMRVLKQLSYEPEKKPEEERKIKFFAADGRPFNINQAKLPFKFNDQEPDKYTLDLSVYKHMETSLIDCNVQPNYVRVTVKDKIFQLHLPREVATSKSTATRSQHTGHLLVTMPFANATVKKPVHPERAPKQKSQLYTEHKTSDCQDSSHTVREYLEIGPPDDVLDFTKMTQPKAKPNYVDPRFEMGERAPSKHFVDDPEVPPLC